MLVKQKILFRREYIVQKLRVEEVTCTVVNTVQYIKVVISINVPLNLLNWEQLFPISCPTRV